MTTILLNTKRSRNHLLRIGRQQTRMVYWRELILRVANLLLTYRVQIPQASSRIGRCRADQQVVIHIKTFLIVISIISIV